MLGDAPLLELSAPPSKSVTHRAIFAAALTQGDSILRLPLICDDTKATISALSALGVNIEQHKKYLAVHGGLKPPQNPPTIDCSESGTTLRFLIALLGLTGLPAKLVGHPSLMARPFQQFLDVLQKHGAKITVTSRQEIIFDRSQFNGGVIETSAEVTSQFVSGLLLCAPLLDYPVKIMLSGPIKSASYMQLTLEIMGRFGVNVITEKDTFIIDNSEKYQPVEMMIEGDYSSASYLLGAALLTGRHLHVSNLRRESLQADRASVEFFRRLGSPCHWQDNGFLIEPCALKAFTADFSDCPDLAPLFGVLAAFAPGISKLSGVSRLKFKESDRLALLISNLDKMGIKNILQDDTLTIFGGKPSPAEFTTGNDHRLSMALSIASLALAGSRVDNEACVSKSFPDFFESLRGLR